MARYRNLTTGAIVDVRDDKALGSEWVALPKSEPVKSANKKVSADKPHSK